MLLARTLITGGATDAAIEGLLDEGAVAGSADGKAAAVVRRAGSAHADHFSSFRVRLFSLNEPPLSLCVRDSGSARAGRVAAPNALPAGAELNAALTASSYGELLLAALNRFRIVCLGLYRKMNIEDPSTSAKRYGTAKTKKFYIKEREEKRSDEMRFYGIQL